MERKKSGQIEWLEFDLLQELPLKHGVFLRHGGVSDGPYNSLNLSYDVGDDPDDVKRNIELVQDVMQCSKMVWAKQCHGKAISSITYSSPDEALNCDALTTKIPGIGLMIKHADCQAAIMYDPIHKALSVVHSGWKGTIENIYSETVEYMQKAYGTKAEDLLVCISPSLGPNEAEFINYKEELPESFWEFQVKPNYFDFWRITEEKLKKSGVLEDHIEIIRISTLGNGQDYYSFRKQKVTGRHGTIAQLNSQI